MKIGIIRIDRMGDMILTLPVIKSIKSINSYTQVDVFASAKNKKIIENFKYIDKVIDTQNKKYLNNKKYDLVLNFSPGWKSFLLCLVLKSKKKANLIFTSRYKNIFYSKLIIFLLSKLFFHQTLLVNRIKKYKNKESIHQTDMMFNLLDKCKLPFKKNISIEKYLPQNKFLISKKKICLLHLSSKWINNYYNENNFLNLIKILKMKFNLILTSDKTTKDKFSLIFDKFNKVNDKNFKNYELIDRIIIFENLNFENWVQSIYSANLIITPECGCTHVAALCKIPTKIIYDYNNKPNMIYAEYSPWQNNHKKYIFGDRDLNLLISKDL